MRKDSIYYGNLNNIRETIFLKLFESDDLFRLIKYKTNALDLDNKTTFPVLSIEEKLSLIDKNIFKNIYADFNHDETNVYLSMEFGQIMYGGTVNNREKSNIYQMTPMFSFHINCHKDIDKIVNGSRVLAIEHCLMKIFHFKDIQALTKTSIMVSETKNINNYITRVVFIKFVDWIGCEL